MTWRTIMTKWEVVWVWMCFPINPVGLKVKLQREGSGISSCLCNFPQFTPLDLVIPLLYNIEHKTSSLYFYQSSYPVAIFFCYCLVAKSCLILCDSMDCYTPGSSVLPYLPEFAQIHVHWVSDAINHFILCGPLLLLSSIFPSIRVFSNKSALRIRRPKYWSFTISISPSSEYSGLISFRIDWFDFLAVQGTLKSLLQHHSSKTSILWC